MRGELRRVVIGRVDMDRGKRPVSDGIGLVNQRYVTVMQRPHGRGESD